jgi:hypothetical protein
LILESKNLKSFTSSFLLDVPLMKMLLADSRAAFESIFRICWAIMIFWYMATMDLTVKHSLFSLVSFFTTYITIDTYLSVISSNLLVNILQIEDQLALAPQVLVKNFNTFVKKTLGSSF